MKPMQSHKELNRHNPFISSQKFLSNRIYYSCVAVRAGRGDPSVSALTFHVFESVQEVLDESVTAMSVSMVNRTHNCVTLIRLLKFFSPSLCFWSQVWVQSGRIPMVSLECVSCKAQSRYEISQSSYVYLAGTCNNCHSSHRGVRTTLTRTALIHHTLTIKPALPMGKSTKSQMLPAGRDA